MTSLTLWKRHALVGVLCPACQIYFDALVYSLYNLMSERFRPVNCAASDRDKPDLYFVKAYPGLFQDGVCTVPLENGKIPGLAKMIIRRGLGTELVLHCENTDCPFNR